MKSSMLKPTVHQMVTKATTGMAQVGSLNTAMLLPSLKSLSTYWLMPNWVSRSHSQVRVTTLTGSINGRKKAARTMLWIRLRRTTISANMSPKAVLGMTVSSTK